MACTAKDAAGFGHKGVDVTGLDEVLWEGPGIGKEFDGVSAVGGTDAGSDAFSGVYSHGKVGAESLAVLRDHAFEMELAGDVEGNGHAEHASAFSDHEVNHLGGDFFRRTNEVALVFAIFVIGDDNHFSGSNVRDDGVDGIEGGFGGGRHGGWVKSRTTAAFLGTGSLWDALSSAEWEEFQRECRLR